MQPVGALDAGRGNIVARFDIPDVLLDEVGDGNIVGQRDPRSGIVLRRPKNKASLDAAWHITEKAVLSVTLLYVGPWVDVNRAGTVTGLMANGYTLLNLAGSYDLGNGVAAYAPINNLFDRHHENPIGFLQPWIGIYAGIRFAFDTARGTGKP